MMKKIKILVVMVVLMCSTSAFAKDFDWSNSWCNYGNGIKKGDVLLSVDTGFSWSPFTAVNTGRWSLPYAIVDLQVACPVWKLPFTFGGYVGASYDNLNHNYGNFTVLFGGSSEYHMMMPPKKLDLYAGIKYGFRVNFSKVYPSGHHIGGDWGLNLGASWFFTNSFGVNLEFGYPINKIGVVFKI